MIPKLTHYVRFWIGSCEVDYTTYFEANENLILSAIIYEGEQIEYSYMVTEEFRNELRDIEVYKLNRREAGIPQDYGYIFSRIKKFQNENT